MGKVLVTAKLTNLTDLFEVEAGTRKPEEVRQLTVEDAFIDTGATGLLAPRRIIEALGLRHSFTRQARGIGGVVPLPMYSIARLDVQGRACHIDIALIADDLPVIIGQVPLELLDWVIDPRGQRLIGNPEHGGEHMMEIF